MPKAPIGSPRTDGYYGFETDRAAHIAIDKKRRRKYDPVYRDLRKLLTIRVRGMNTCIACCVWLIWLGRWWTFALAGVVGVMALTSLVRVRALVRTLRVMGDCFWNSPLVGAVVVRREPLTALGLVRLGELETNRRWVSVYFDGRGQRISQEEYDEGRRRADEEWERVWKAKYDEAAYPEDERIWTDFWEDPRHVFEERREEAVDRKTVWGCQTVVVGDGDWERYSQRGNRIPCSSMYAERDEETGIWQEAVLLPLMWGTDNRRNLSECVDAISLAEWRMLEELAPLAEEMEADELYRIEREPEGTSVRFRLVRVADREG